MMAGEPADTSIQMSVLGGAQSRPQTVPWSLCMLLQWLRCGVSVHKDTTTEGQGRTSEGERVGCGAGRG